MTFEEFSCCPRKKVLTYSIDEQVRRNNTFSHNIKILVFRQRKDEKFDIPLAVF